MEHSSIWEAGSHSRGQEIRALRFITMFTGV